MDELQKTLDAFRASKASVAAVVAAFDNALQTDLEACRTLLTELESSGWFPLQLIPLLESRIPIATAVPEPQPATPSAGGESPDRTIVSPRPRRSAKPPSMPPPSETTRQGQDETEGDAEQSVPVAAPSSSPAEQPADREPVSPSAGAPSPGGADQPETVAAAHIRGRTPTPRPPERDPTADLPAGAETFVNPPERPATTDAPTSHPSEQSSGTGHPSRTGSEGSANSTGNRKYPPVEGEPEVGTLLRQRFLLEKVMGRGGMGVVYKARDLSKEEVSFSKDEKNYVAIKLLNEKFKQHPDSIKALGREFSRTQELRHPNIINLYDFDKDDRGNYFIAMELLQGRPLNDFIRDLRKTGGLPFAEAFPIIEQMGLALAAAHNQTPPIIHSDFKPGNVFIADDGTVKVFDFGIAQAARPTDDELGRTGIDEKTNFDAKTLGALTPAYASLEMLGGLAPSANDDIYALAIVAYELLSGQRPFGRRTNAMEAKAKGLAPPRIKNLTRRQWRGLERGLAFDRKDRTPSADAFLDALRPRRSQLPLAIAAGVAGAAGIGVAAWLLAIDPWLTEQEYLRLKDAVAQATQPESLPAPLASAAALPDAQRRDITDDVVERLAEAIAGSDEDTRARALAVNEALDDAQLRARVQDAAAQRLTDELMTAERVRVLARLAVIDQLPPKMSREIIKDAEDAILDALVEEARIAFEPARGAFDYQRAVALLDQAESIDRDSKRVSDTKEELESTRKSEVNRLTADLNTLSEQGALLPAEDGAPSVPALLDTLARIDPTLDLTKYNYLISSYLDASKNVQGNDPALAQRYIEQALTLFPEDPNNQLKNRLASLEDLAQQQARAATLAELQNRVRDELAALGAGEEPSSRLIADLRQLRHLAPEDPLLDEAETAIQTRIDSELPALLAERDWAVARALVERWPTLVGDAFVADRTARIDTERERLNAQIADIAERIGNAIRANDLDGADDALGELKALAADAPEVARAKTAIDRGYLKLAREARGTEDWERARSLATQGMERTDQRQLKLAFEDELRAIDNDQTASEQAIAEAEREQRAAERRERIAEVEAEFTAFVAEMNVDEEDAQAARALLDRLGGLDPSNALLTEGPEQIAARFVEAARTKANTEDWQPAINLIRSGQRVLPGSAVLDTELASLQADFERFTERQRLDAIDVQVKAVRNLIAEADSDEDWSQRLAEALAKLARVADGDRSVIAPLEQQIAQRFEDEISDLRDRNLFTAARNQLKRWRQLVPKADAEQDRVGADLDAAIAAWEQAEDERRRQAEIAALTQTLRTQTEADQPGDAEQTLTSLRERLGDDDPFVAREGPGLIADAYERLAEQSAKRGVTDTALALLDKAQALVPERDLSDLRERYERQAERDRLGALIASTPVAELGGLRDDIDALQQRAPDDFDDWRSQWIKTLVRRIETASSPDNGKALRDAALALFPGDPQLAEATVPKPPESQLLKQVRKALDDNRLTQAGDLLERARRETPTHPDLPELDAQRDAAIADAEGYKQCWRQALAQFQMAKAEKCLADARTSWTDDPETETRSGTRTAQARVAPQPAQPTRTRVQRDVCNARYAGHGRRSAARCADSINGEPGPPLVVIPPGGGSSIPFAITRYEISIGDYNRYCQQSRECQPIRGSNKMPLTGVTKAQAEAYARWLSRVSGARYRLPSDGEWLFAAQSDNARPSGTANCLLRSGGQIIKGGAPSLVSTGPQNNWGLVNHVGNVQEWTLSGGALQARGGYFGDDANNCAVTLRRPHSGGADRNTGFRLVRDIRG